MPIFILSLLILLLPNGADALKISVCKCGDKPTIEKESKRAFAIFTGTVDNIDVGLGLKKKTKVKFNVHRSWKGAKHETISVWAAGDDLYSKAKESFNCNYTFSEGETYLIFSHRSKNRKGPSFVSTCGNTMPYGAEAKVIIDEFEEPILANSKEKSDAVD